MWSVIHTLGEVLVFHHNFRHPHAHKREMYTHSSATQIHLLHSQHHKATSSSPAPTSTHPPSPSISLSLSLPASSLLPLSIIPTALFPQVSPPFYFLSSSPPTLHPSNPSTLRSFTSDSSNQTMPRLHPHIYFQSDIYNKVPNLFVHFYAAALSERVWKFFKHKNHTYNWGFGEGGGHS